ncbi:MULTISPECIES: cold-shock protein [Rhizobium]|uniref:Cold-shock protein n=1 Tax=Rhizobium straminoryzae TaxID=1387186 RepID=A0A549T4B9_9HYPH|nr:MULTISPECIES: cold-shock protein [Rhizobium]TRL36733.1 cold-shock protein [Rhizobium straminoryzae]
MLKDLPGPGGSPVSGHISAMLPSTNGHIQYRIRLENEAFERRIIETDIDAEQSDRPIPEEAAVLPAKGTSWLNPQRIKVGK